MAAAESTFPHLTPRRDLPLHTHLEKQIYTVDDLLSPSELNQLLRWAKSLELDGPKPAGKGEAERTARESFSLACSDPFCS